MRTEVVPRLPPPIILEAGERRPGSDGEPIPLISCAKYEYRVFRGASVVPNGSWAEISSPPIVDLAKEEQ